MFEGKQIDWYVILVTLSVLGWCGFVGFLKCFQEGQSEMMNRPSPMFSFLRI